MLEACHQMDLSNVGTGKRYQPLLPYKKLYKFYHVKLSGKEAFEESVKLPMVPIIYRLYWRIP